jgi:SAM-dependent methyltransferase
MIELLAPMPGQTILDLAAGPGETGFLALPRLQPGGRLVSTDAAPEMVGAARRRAAALGLTDVAFRVEDAAQLTFSEGAFDGILCRFGLMLVPEMERVAGEIARVLRPGGRAAIAVWAAAELNPWITASSRAAIALGLSEPPARDAPGPFRLSEEPRLREVVEAGKLDVVAVEDVPVVWRARSLGEWWETTRDTSRMLSLLLAKLDANETAALRRAAGQLLREFVAADGSMSVPGLARVVVATPR